MSHNPFNQQLEQAFKNKRVMITKNSKMYRGTVAMINYNGPDYLLIDAVNDNRENCAYIQITQPDTVQLSSSEMAFEWVDPNDISPCPYDVRTFDDEDFYRFIRKIRWKGVIFSPPEIRDTDDGWEVISGHKRIKAAQSAGIDNLLCERRDVTDWELLVTFVNEHFPITEDEKNDGTGKHRGWYNDEQIQKSLDKMLEQWSIEELQQLHIVKEYIKTYTEYEL